MSATTLASHTSAGSSAPAATPSYSHREILEILVGLILAMFVANLSSTIVSNALPTIIKQLNGTQQQYTWIVTASLLASTASTPIWGKLADMFDKKKLLQAGLTIFIIGSFLSGLAPSTGALIGFRILQGVGLGAVMSLVQTIIATIIPPRERGKYAAYTGAAMALATVCGPLIGGFIVDQDALGWRWCFYSAIPLAMISMAVLQWRLKLPHIRRHGAKVDWMGSTLIMAGVSLLLIWISFVDHEFEWVSWQTFAMVGGAIVVLGLFIFVEKRVAEPVIPLDILTERTTALAVVGSIAVGIGMFGASVFLGQYYQIARGYSPTEAGLMTIPLMAGVLVSSIVFGRWVSKVGKWKPFIVAGSIILALGFIMMSFMDEESSLVYLGFAMAICGLGVGMTMQNLVLAVQNTVPIKDVGAATATVTFFRSLGGAIGIQVLGAIFARHVADEQLRLVGELPQATQDKIAAASAAGGADTSTLDLTKLPEPIQQIVRTAYGNSMGSIFLVAAVISVITIVAVLFMKATKLRDTLDLAAAKASVSSGPDSPLADSLALELEEELQEERDYAMVGVVVAEEPGTVEAWQSSPSRSETGSTQPK